jgi:hypothetical protein
MRLLRGERADLHGRALVHDLARVKKFAPGAFGEGLGTHGGQHVVPSPQLVTGWAPTARDLRYWRFSSRSGEVADLFDRMDEVERRLMRQGVADAAGECPVQVLAGEPRRSRQDQGAVRRSRRPRA